MASVSKILSKFTPRPCPFPLVRVGGDSDGAYLIPDDLEEIVSCFSPGVCNVKDFEDELLDKYGIRSHMCDLSSSAEEFKTPLIPGSQTFQKKWLDLYSGPSTISLFDWIDSAEYGEHGDFLLQIDIEGAEYRNLVFTPQECLNRFRIIVVELHWLSFFDNSFANVDSRVGFSLFSCILNVFRRLLAKPFLVAWRQIDFIYPRRRFSARIVSFLARLFGPYLIEEFAVKISRTHTCVHAHPNNCCGDFIDKSSGKNVPRTLELTFLRNDRFTASDGELIVPMIPHPLDIVNDASKPPLELNSFWS